MEPPDLWWNALGLKSGDRTPRLLDEYRGKEGSFFYSGYLGSPVRTRRSTYRSRFLSSGSLTKTLA